MAIVSSWYRSPVLGTVLALSLNACQLQSAPGNQNPNSKRASVSNPVFHFEIPVTDMERAVAFYENVFGIKLRRDLVDGYDMAFFARDDNSPGASGALAKGDVYRPSLDGSIVYFDVSDIDETLGRVVAAGARVLYEKTDIGDAGFVAEFEDTEGNRIALTQPRD